MIREHFSVFNVPIRIYHSDLGAFIEYGPSKTHKNIVVTRIYGHDIPGVFTESIEQLTDTEFEEAYGNGKKMFEDTRVSWIRR